MRLRYMPFYALIGSTYELAIMWPNGASQSVSMNVHSGIAARFRSATAVGLATLRIYNLCRENGMEVSVLGHRYCSRIAAPMAFHSASKKLTFVQQAGVATILCFFSLKETYSMAILEKKTRHLRKETSNRGLHSKLDRGLSPAKAFKRTIF